MDGQPVRDPSKDMQQQRAVTGERRPEDEGGAASLVTLHGHESAVWELSPTSGSAPSERGERD